MDKIPTAGAPRPITARAAENGLYLSGAMCLLLVLLGAATTVPFAAILFWIGALALPFLAARLLSRNCLRSGQFLSFSEIWAEGIASFFLASLLPAVMSYLLLRFAFPTFLADQMQIIIDSLGAMGTPQADNLATTLTGMRDRGLTPTPADVAANIISINIVAGTALSLLLAIIISAKIRMARMRKRQSNL